MPARRVSMSAWEALSWMSRAPWRAPMDHRYPKRPEVGWVVRVIQQVGEKVPISPDDAGVATRRDLIMAGYRSETAVKVFNGIKLSLCVLLVIFAFAVRSEISNPVLRVVSIGFAGFMGFFVPGYMLDKKIAKRQDTIRLSLPDDLDMLVVSVEAGLGLDQAIWQHVGRELQISHKELSEELSLVNLEMRAGKRRSEALRNLAERTGEPELQKLGRHPGADRPLRHQHRRLTAFSF